MRAAAPLAAVAVAAALAGCGGDGDGGHHARRVATDADGSPAGTATAGAPAPPAAGTPAPGTPTPGTTAPGAPAPRTPLPRSAVRLAPRLAAVSGDLRRAVGEWRATRPPAGALPPRRIVLLALFQQRSYRLLARSPALARATLRRLPPRVRAEARDSAGSLRALFTLTGLATERRFRTGPPTPPATLLRFYREAARRFHLRWEVLAAVNFIESNFGRLRNTSDAGAVGPMQFLPATWAAYGLGGDVRDPHDAILGAANYLHASGAPASDARAVYAYNPSPLYVRAVLGYARRMRRDRRAFYEYWSWQSFRRTATRDVQLTGPGAGRRPR